MWRRLCTSPGRVVLGFAVLASSVSYAHAQTQPGGIIYNPNAQTPNLPKIPGDSPSEIDPVREYSRQRAREKERQRRIVDDANRLVKLTAQYRSDVEQHGSVTPEDEKLLTQIEKLAREVKDRMRGM